jgi:penicillin amidase
VPVSSDPRAATLSGNVQILRDAYGVAHVRAKSSGDAFFAMGFACAEDRLFQMDYDRRRATGRVAEIAGRTAVDSDILARRLDLATAAKNDVAAMSPSTLEAFEAYTAGVNRAIETLPPPLESSLFGFEIEPWLPWHSVATFKVRHVLMGPWQHKLAMATLLHRSGSSVFGNLRMDSLAGSPVTVPSGGRLGRLLADATEEIEIVASRLGFLSESEPGSNAWAVSGDRTAHGAAVLCNDSHRALDTPNVYWQCHVACPDFDVVGATFAGVPAFPHFGHNHEVAWAITHVGADTQDLYIEAFDPEVPGRYATAAGWSVARRRVETIAVKAEAPVETVVWTTHHGPVVHGDPLRGEAFALRDTASDRPCRGFECLLPMLTASSVAEMLDAQRDWVDPVNNFVAADRAGNIGYQTRGELPERSSDKFRGLPIPGWTDACEWLARVPFASMPREINPAGGYIMTANNAVTAAEKPYISYTFADPFRAERLRFLLEATPVHTSEGLAAMQGDVESWAARAWARLLSDLGPVGGSGSDEEQARAMLANWDGSLHRESPEAVVYGCFRRALAEALYSPLLGEATWRWMASEAVPTCAVTIRRWLARDTWRMLGGPAPEAEVTGDGRAEAAGSRGGAGAVMEVLPKALENAFAAARSLGGLRVDTWRWGDVHRTETCHPLSHLHEDAGSPLEPPPVRIGGDSDTLQAASYGWRLEEPFTVTALSVYRQVVDLADPASASYVVPGGVSGNPNSSHFADQLPLWAEHRRVVMFPGWEELLATKESETILHP